MRCFINRMARPAVFYFTDALAFINFLMEVVKFMHKENCKILALHHYSRMKPLKCSIVSGDIDNFFTVKAKEKIEFENDIVKGDPVIIGTPAGNDDVRVFGGSVIAINKDTGTLVISPDKVLNFPNRREHERFPVSLFGYIRCHEDSKGKSFACIKDMSYGGFRIYTGADLKTGDSIELDIYFDHNVFSVSGIVVRQSVCYGRNEYGIQIIYREKDSISTVKDYLDRLLENEKELLKRHLVADMK